MLARHRIRKGFTLVEILIVVVILGILAAIVIPQFTSASESAKAGNLVSQLQTIRSQLELAQIQHQGTYPDLVTKGWTVMTSKTDPVGGSGAGSYSTANADGTASNEVGPYLQKAPINPFTGGSTLKADNTGDWKYDNTTGAVQAVLPADKFAQAAQLGIPASDVVSQ